MLSNADPMIGKLLRFIGIRLGLLNIRFVLFWHRWHDIFALHKRGAMQIEGESQVLFANLQYIKDVLNSPRLLAGV